MAKRGAVKNRVERVSGSKESGGKSVGIRWASVGIRVLCRASGILVLACNLIFTVMCALPPGPE